MTSKRIMRIKFSISDEDGVMVIDDQEIGFCHLDASDVNALLTLVKSLQEKQIRRLMKSKRRKS